MFRLWKFLEYHIYYLPRSSAVYHVTLSVSIGHGKGDKASIQSTSIQIRCNIGTTFSSIFLNLPISLYFAVHLTLLIASLRVNKKAYNYQKKKAIFKNLPLLCRSLYFQDKNIFSDKICHSLSN